MYSRGGSLWWLGQATSPKAIYPAGATGRKTFKSPNLDLNGMISVWLESNATVRTLCRGHPKREHISKELPTEED